MRFFYIIVVFWPERKRRSLRRLLASHLDSFIIAIFLDQKRRSLRHLLASYLDSFIIVVFLDQKRRSLRQCIFWPHIWIRSSSLLLTLGGEKKIVKTSFVFFFWFRCCLDQKGRDGDIAKTYYSMVFLKRTFLCGCSKYDTLSKRRLAHHGLGLEGW